MDSVPGQIDRYRVLEEVGRGGMSVVYRGVDQSLEREVAIKVLHPHLAGEPESRARFQREARAVARLHHPHIIEIFDFADGSEGPSYIVTEFIHGKTLKAFMEEHRAFFPEVGAMIAIQICEAIGHAHHLQIIHRDLKPENVMVNENGVLKLMDFGIAKVLDQQQQMTLTGALLGSPAHMAPELVEGKELDFRSDLFSVGTILYWLATGHSPFFGNNPHQVIKRVVEGDFTDPQQANPITGSDLSRIIRRALEHDPENRFPSAAAMQAALHATLTKLDLAEVDSEVKFFLENPKNYLVGLKQQVTRKLLENGKAALKGGDQLAALDDLDRLLAIEPGHPEVIPLVDGIYRRRRRRRQFAVSAISLGTILLLGLGVWAAIHLWPNHQLEAVAAGSQTAEKPAVPAIVDEAEANAVAGPDSQPGSAGEKGNQGKLASHPVHRLSRHPLLIYTDPYFDRILIDGKQVAFNDLSTKYGQKYSGLLTSGKHQVVIQRKACQDDEFEIEVPTRLRPGQSLEFRRKLLFRPATLVIDTDLAKTEVWVDAVFKGDAGDPKANPIAITMEGRRGERQAFLRLTHPELGELRKKVWLKAGEPTVVRARREDFKAQSLEEGEK